MDDHTSDLPQKLHNEPTPRIGGLGIFIACVFMTRNLDLGLSVVLCLVPAFLAGFLEDLFARISPLKRLWIMSFSGLLSVYFLQAVVIDYGFIKVPETLGLIISVIAILGLINGMNLIDGFNGLSSGVGLLILAADFIISLRVGDSTMAYISLIGMAALAGFLFFNFPYGRIFLGDGGAYSLGFLLAIISILLVKRNLQISPWFALVCLIYPVWEVIFSFCRRMLIYRLSPLHPDSKHMHQLIFRNITHGHNAKTTLFILPFILLFNAGAVLFYHQTLYLMVLTLLFEALYTLLYAYFYRKELQAVARTERPLSSSSSAGMH